MGYVKKKMILIAVPFLLWSPKGLIGLTTAAAEEDWRQFKYDCRHSGDVPDRSVTTPLGLIGAVPLTDAIFTAPVVADGRVYVVDGSGVAFCIDAATLRVIWKFEAPGGRANCNNISSPAIVGHYLHFGTMAGSYYVLDADNGTVIKEIACGEPIFSTPVVANDRVYFATLSSQIYALEPDGTVCWKWDFVKEIMGFTGNRWSGEDWCKHKKGRVTWRDQFCCSKNIAAHGEMIVVPAGGTAVCLADAGKRAELRSMASVPAYAGSEEPSTFGLSIGEDGAVYRQWHRRDNTGRVEIIRLQDSKSKTSYVSGTQTEINRPGSLSFCSVSVRGQDVYRCRPEEGFGFCKHSTGKPAQYLGGYPSISPPILLRNTAVYGGLDGSLYVVPLSGSGKVWSFETAFGKAISAPVTVCNGRVYFGCEDGYLYVLGPGGKAPLPLKRPAIVEDSKPLNRQIHRFRIRLVYQLRQPGKHECKRPGYKTAFRNQVDSPVRGYIQASTGVRRRKNVYSHGRGPDFCRRAGNRPAIVAAILAWSAYFLYLSSLHKGSSVSTSGGDEKIPYALPKCSDGRAVMGGSLHGLTELEPTATSNYIQKPCHLCFWHG